MTTGVAGGAPGEMLDSTGQRMIPYGMTVFGLSEPDYASYRSADTAQISQAATHWCTNFIRLQISQYNMFPAGDGHPADRSYLAAVEAEVTQALSLHQDVLLCDQTEHDTDRATEAKDPDAETVSLWRVVDQTYHGNDRVWYDVFNEPRNEENTPAGWQQWLRGATVGAQEAYPGMQAVVSQIRSFTPNLLLVEGPNGGKSLTYLSQYPITGVPDIVYAVHPYRQFTVADWQSNFGDVADGTPTVAGVPVLADEWNQHNGDRKQCTATAPTMVPAFLGYLRAHDIGLGGWALTPGVLVTDDTTFTPTTIRPTYSCGVPRREATQENSLGGSVPDAEGAGLLLQQYFATYSGMRGVRG